MAINDPFPEINAGTFNTDQTQCVAPASGYSGIFHFPFRIYSSEELREHQGQGPDFRYRVYAPYLVRQTGSPLTEDVPFKLWPDFIWHQAVPTAMREINAAPDLHYTKPDGDYAISYDGLRLDFWADDAINRISRFVLSATRWLRNLSGQPWISDVDRHYASTLKRSFPIDALGAAVHEAIGLTKLKTAQFKLVTDRMWASAFEYAGQFEVPVFSNLYFDAVNAAAINDYPRAIMNLAMALEAARDFHFSKIHPADFLVGRGPKLKAPFDRTDLLKHLTSHAAAVFGRDFSKDYPSHWPALKALYLARQHVAHGKGPVFPTAGGIEVVDKQSFSEMQASAQTALVWMEELGRSRTPRETRISS